MTYNPPIWQWNGHLQTIYPSLFRKVQISYLRERLTLSDGDFVDLDWASTDQSRLVIITHGLEGDSTRHYVTGMVRAFQNMGYDALGWNCRSCSGEMNRLPRFYHHGDAGDLKQVVEYAAQKYDEIVLVGFSMGGSLTLRYLGEYPDLVLPQVKKSIVASVPLDLPSSVQELDKSGKRFYMRRFLKKLEKKIQQKEMMFPGHPILTTQDYHLILNFEDFDNRYTAPLHGYENCHDFYRKASVKPLLPFIQIPSLIVQAANDPFLTPACLEVGSLPKNSPVQLLISPEGGHVGFMQANRSSSWVEDLAVQFSSM